MQRFSPNLGRLVSPKLCEIALAKMKKSHMTFLYRSRCQLRENTCCVDFGISNAVNEYPITGAVFCFVFFINKYEQLVI